MRGALKINSRDLKYYLIVEENPIVAYNNKYQILTPSGWSNFGGIKKSITNVIFKITFDDGLFIECTDHHQLKYPNGSFLDASQVLIGDELFGGKVITSKTYEIGEFEVFDAIDVELGDEYMSNGVVSHNCAHIDCMEAIWTSAQLTLATGGSAIILSTPNGVGNVYHSMWQTAIEGSAQGGLGRFNPISLPWNLHPDRDQAWRDLQDEQLGKLKAAQECDVEFLTSGHTVIDSELLEHYTKNSCKDPIERRGVEGNLWIWKYPQYNRDYLLSADVSRGDGEDYSTFHVLDVETMEQMAEYRAKVDTQIFGNILISVATEYNTALLVVDNRNIGWSTVQVIVNSGYTNLYYGHKHNDPYFDVNIHIRKNYDLTNKEDMVPGFTITPKNRPVMISMLDTYMREKSTKLYSRRLINELYVFKWIEGKPQAAKGYNDDLIMAFCMVLFVRETALRMRQVGIELHKKTVSNIHRSVYKSRIGGNKSWEMPTGTGQSESLRWLL